MSPGVQDSFEQEMPCNIPEERKLNYTGEAAWNIELEDSEGRGLAILNTSTWHMATQMQKKPRHTFKLQAGFPLMTPESDRAKKKVYTVGRAAIVNANNRFILTQLSQRVCPYTVLRLWPSKNV